jgi:hypothetical protein
LIPRINHVAGTTFEIRLSAIKILLMAVWKGHRQVSNSTR